MTIEQSAQLLEWDATEHKQRLYRLNCSSFADEEQGYEFSVEREASDPPAEDFDPTEVAAEIRADWLKELREQRESINREMLEEMGFPEDEILGILGEEGKT